MTLSPTTHTPAEIPSNIYKPNAPLTARVLEHFPLTAPDSPNDVRHIVLDIAGSDLKYLEGQSIGVLPPGEDANGKPHKLRLYSIASPAVGDDGQGKSLSVCIKRAIFVDPATGQEFRGVCSSFLCDLKVGDSVKLTGPVGKSFLMPDVPNANIIMVATGTGIAPFRGFLHNRYNHRKNESGQTWLFFGAQTRKDYLYEEEMEAYAETPDCHILTAFSREEKNAEGGRMYVQHRLIEHGETLFNLLKQRETYFYMCGLRGMEAGMQEGLQEIAKRQGIDWSEFFGTLKAEKRWHVEVY
jgi:ferredoxin--NADP+ reductase